jgi:hypothetical protein
VIIGRNKMEEKKVYYPKYREKHELEGFGGWLVVFATFNIIYLIDIFSRLSYISQMKMAMIFFNAAEVPDAYLNAARLGYRCLLPLSIIMLWAFFKNKKFYIYLEALNFVARAVLIGVIIYTIGDANVLFNEYASTLAMSIFTSMLTIVYFLNSKRVKVTFVL